MKQLNINKGEETKLEEKLEKENENEKTLEETNNEENTNIKAGILTSLHSHDTFPPETEKPKKHSSGQWPVVTEHKGAYSCGTVGDSHSVRFLCKPRLAHPVLRHRAP